MTRLIPMSLPHYGVCGLPALHGPVVSEAEPATKKHFALHCFLAPSLSSEKFKHLGTIKSKNPTSSKTLNLYKWAKVTIMVSTPWSSGALIIVTKRVRTRRKSHAGTPDGGAHRVGESGIIGFVYSLKGERNLIFLHGSGQIEFLGRSGCVYCLLLISDYSSSSASFHAFSNVAVCCWSKKQFLMMDSHQQEKPRVSAEEDISDVKQPGHGVHGVNEVNGFVEGTKEERNLLVSIHALRSAYRWISQYQPSLQPSHEI